MVLNSGLTAITTLNSNLNSVEDALSNNILQNVDLLYWSSTQGNGFRAIRTNPTVTGQPGALYMIGWMVKYGNNIIITLYDMFTCEIMYSNSSTDNGATWHGWVEFHHTK